MKKVFILSITTILSLSIFAQQCKIVCVDLQKSKKGNSVKPIPFILEIKNPETPTKPFILKSGDNGILLLAPSLFAKIKDWQILSFNFKDPLMHEFYGMPYSEQDIRKKKVKDMCSSTIVVNPLW